MATVELKLLTYQTLFAEGVIFLARSLYKEAIEVFTKCYSLLTEIEGSTEVIKSFTIHTLLHRSKAHLDIGGHSKQALADALLAFGLNETDPSSLLAVAEAYYDSGEFEQALISFHRGLKIKPELKEFTKGIHKCSGVIESALSGSIVKKKQNVVEKPYHSKKPEESKIDYSELEEINIDRVFMRELLQDKVFLDGVESLKYDIEESVAFLESRVGFWKQKNMHAISEGPSKKKARQAKADEIVKSLECPKLVETPLSVNLVSATLIKSGRRN